MACWGWALTLEEGACLVQARGVLSFSPPANTAAEKPLLFPALCSGVTLAKLVHPFAVAPENELVPLAVGGHSGGSDCDSSSGPAVGLVSLLFQEGS